MVLSKARVGRLVTRFQQRRLKSADTVWTHTGGKSFLATPVERFRSTDRANLSLATLLTALDHGDVPHRVVKSPPEVSRVVVTDLPLVFGTLARAPQSWYALTDGKVTLARHARTGTVDSATAFRTWATPSGQFLAGSDVGVELVTDEVSVDSGQGSDFPMDAVFTWVDGADPLWQQKKLARQTGRLGGLHETAANAARYESLDELRYAMRSIEMYAPWFRQVVLVTDQQVPEWLNVEHPRVRVVDHREIFDVPEALPTFNSHAIEARLHRIPALAEHYVYFNDDLFLARALAPSFFFDRTGRPRVFLAADEIDERSIVETDPPVVTAAKNNRDLLLELTGYELRHKLKHVPHPQLKSLALELEHRASDLFRATASSPFRSPRDLSIASSLLPHYALATGRGVEGSMQHFYADVASPELRWRLPVLQQMGGVDVVCLNATSSVAHHAAVELTAFLETQFPVRTCYERELTVRP